MKKNWLIAVVAAVMTIGMSATSYAAGWKIEDGAWVYEDSSGYLVTNEWKRGGDNQWRYLDGSGRMAVSSWVDNEYYVDENGIMVSGGWKQLQSNTVYDDEFGDERWYYFQDSGKIVRDTWKKINGKWYHFDTDGAMETGWVDDNMYYCDEGGDALIGWHMLYPPEEEQDDYDKDPFADDNDGKYWYYFNTSGKKYVPSDGMEYGEKRIDGAYYCFDSNGVMQTGWVNVGSDSSDGMSIENYRFYGSDGKSVTGWYTTEPPEGLSGSSTDEVEWFYFSRSGVPKVGPAEGEASSSDFTRINNKTYLFNEFGNPVYGLQRVKVGSDEYTTYYFDEITRTALKGRMEIEQKDGSIGVFHFAESGKGTTGVYSGSLYYMGLLQKAEEGTRYQPITIPGHGTYLVNAAGRVTKSTSGVKDADGTKYTTDSSGKLKKVNDEPVDASGTWTSPTEPSWK